MSYLSHHGVLGMKWGIRRYQSYDAVPRKSGKGGKEIGNVRSKNKLEGRMITTPSGTLRVQTPAETKLTKFLAKHNANIRDAQTRTTFKDFYYENKKIGDIQTFKESNDELNIVWLSVKKKYNGRGYGQAIFKDTLDEARKQGYKKVTLEVPGSSPNARHIYEKYGFIDMGQISDDDDVWGGLTRMELNLRKDSNNVRTKRRR